jgi:NAD(P)-dependent dehydrogenase (short-subunit alcohol dehydrogenase family)
MGEIRFDGRVAVVTGAGNGLGRAYAIALAAAGASVVVNDLGGDPSGYDPSPRAADEVVDLIRAQGGKAVANHDSVATRAGGAAIIDSAIEAFGRIDIVVNNAGILRNALFDELTDEQIDGVFDTHVKGLFYVSQPAYRLMRRQGYGRFVFTSSGTGMFGNSHQANYGAAKGAVTALMHIVGIEGEAHGIKANALIPGAVTRLMGDVDPALIEEAGRLSGPLQDKMTPEWVAPLVLYLASEGCAVNRSLYTAAAGRFALVFAGIAKGWMAPGEIPPTPAEVAEHLAEISDITVFKAARETLDDLRFARECFG